MLGSRDVCIILFHFLIIVIIIMILLFEAGSHIAQAGLELNM